MRLFIGIRLPEAVQQQLQERWTANAHHTDDVRMIESEQRHLTLAFLEEVSEDNREALAHLVAKAVERPPKGSFSFSCFESFPSKGPKFLTAKLVPSIDSTWLEFVDRLRDLVSISAPKVDRKPWLPHVQIARSRKNTTLIHWSEPFEPFNWKPQTISIMLSEPNGEGSKYTNLYDFPLNI